MMNSKIYDYYKEQEKLNGQHIEPIEEDMEPTDEELAEIEHKVENMGIEDML